MKETEKNLALKVEDTDGADSFPGLWSWNSSPGNIDRNNAS
jgi:hypothetical protein